MLNVTRRSRPSVELLESRLVLDRTILTTEHVDIDIAYDAGKFDLGIHDETNKVEYAPDEALFFAGENTRTTQPAGRIWEFIGAGAGNRIWVLPQNQLPDRLFLGVGAEEIKEGILFSYFEADPRVRAEGEWVQLALADVRGPGQFSIWRTDEASNPVVWMSTFRNPLSNSVYILAGSHQDYNFGFTATGIYEVDVAALAVDGESGELVFSDIVTYVFGVEETETGPGSAPGVGQPSLDFQAGLALSLAGSESPFSRK